MNGAPAAYDPEGGGRSTRAVAPLLALSAMLCFQTGTTLSVPLLLAVGPMSTTWLRLLGAASILWIVSRPALAGYSARAVAAAVALDVATCGMAVFYAEAIARIPLGMATAIEFIGPLAVAVAASRRLLDVGWATLAAIGVAFLTLTRSGWSGDPVGIGFASAAALCWATYIVLTKQVSQTFKGLHGLTLSVTAAALVATPLGISRIQVTASPWELAASFALGIITPVLPYGLEVLALRRMSTRAFGILMSIEPALSALAGWVAFHQSLGDSRVFGLACVVMASLCTTATGRVRETAS